MAQGRNDFDAGNGLSNGFSPIKIIKSKRHIKKQVHIQW
jgi:hypothetical protein